MTRYERDQFFTALCQLRERYSHRGDDDRVGTLSMEDIVAWAEREMVALGPAEATPSAPANQPKA